MGMIIFIRHIYIFRNSIFGKFFKIWISNNINNAFAGIQHFFCKIFWNKYRCFRYTKSMCARMYMYQDL